MIMPKVWRGIVKTSRTELMNYKSIWMRLKLMPSNGAEKWLPNWKAEQRTLKLNLMVSNVDLVTLQRLSDKMRTGKMLKGCKNWLTNCKTKFANIKGKSKRLKKLLLLIWPNSERLKLIWEKVWKGQTSVNKLWPNPGFVADPCPWPEICNLTSKNVYLIRISWRFLTPRVIFRDF